MAGHFFLITQRHVNTYFLRAKYERFSSLHSVRVTKALAEPLVAYWKRGLAQSMGHIVVPMVPAGLSKFRQTGEVGTLWTPGSCFPLDVIPKTSHLCDQAAVGKSPW